MELTEYQSKQLLVELGIGIPEGYLARSDEEAAAFAEQLMPSRLVLKAQIQAGGRALGYFKDNRGEPREDSTQGTRESGVRFVSSPDDVRAHSRRMLGRTLITEQTGVLGQPVNRVYLEKFVDIGDELYIAFTIDEKTGEVLCLTSKAGGVSIEAKAIADDTGNRDGTSVGINRFSLDITAYDKGDQSALRPVFERVSESCLLYTSPSPRDQRGSRMPSSA